MEPLWISLKTAGVATCITFVVAVLAARARMSLTRPLGTLLNGFLLLPLAIPPTSLGFALAQVLGPDSPVGRFLENLHIHILLAWPAAVIASITVSFPIGYIAALGAFRGVNRDLIDASRILGMSEFAILWRVLLPLGWPTIAGGLILAFIRALSEFGATLMLGGNIPGVTRTAPIAIFFDAQTAGGHTLALRLSFALLAIAISALVLLQHLSRKFEQE